MANSQYGLEYIADPKTIKVSSNNPLFYVKNMFGKPMNNLLNSNDLDSIWNPNYYKLTYHSNNNNYPIYQLSPNQNNAFNKYKLVYFPNYSSTYPLFQVKTYNDQVPLNLSNDDLKYLYDWNNYNLVYYPNNYSMYPTYQLIPKNNKTVKDTNYYYSKYLKYKNKYLNLIKKLNENKYL